MLRLKRAYAIILELCGLKPVGVVILSQWMDSENLIRR
jgi:hypothetical protein